MVSSKTAEQSFNRLMIGLDALDFSSLPAFSFSSFSRLFSKNPNNRKTGDIYDSRGDFVCSVHFRKIIPPDCEPYENIIIET